MNRILVSAIIPAFNAEAYIAEAVDSVLKQTYENIEIIVVDDGSTDATMRILNDYQGRVKVICQRNAGSSAARNRGVRDASGQYVAFLDADDLWEPEKTAAQLSILTPGMGLAYTDRINFGNLGALSEHQSEGVEQFSGSVYDKLLLNNFITTSSVLMKRQLFLDIGGFDERLVVAHDWDLWLRVAEHHRIGFCSRPLVRYRVHSAGLSKVQIERMFLEQEEILGTAFKRGQHQSLSFNRNLRKQASCCSAASSAFAAANAGQWPLAMKFYQCLIRRSPFSAFGYKGILKCLLRRA